MPEFIGIALMAAMFAFARRWEGGKYFVEFRRLRPLEVNTMTDDAQLLRQYVATGAEAAFAELVQRHLPLVYHAAARQLGGEEHLAADVAQAVFLLLAEKAPELVGHTRLAGWLHATTRYKVAETLRTERRRRARETAALLMNETLSDAEKADWARVRPVLDEALLELNADDREAVLLRFFERQPFAAIATRLAVTEAAAHKRVERALEKLRARLARRGLTSTAAALATLLTGHAVAAVPSGLAASVTSAVAASGLPVAAAVGAVSFMSTKVAVATAAVLTLVVGGVAVRQVNTARAMAAQLQTQEMENADWRTRIAAARQRPASAAAAAPAARPVPSTPPAAGASGGLASVEESRAFLRANPEVREAFARYLRLSLENQYAELIAELGLDEARKERFLALLAQGRRQIVGEHQLTLAEREFTPGEYGRLLREVLGEAGFAAYQEFGRKGVLRGINHELTRALYATPTPLTAAQTDDVQRIVWSVLNDPSAGAKYSGSVWTSIPMERWDRILAEASKVLLEPQVEALREMAQQTRFWHAQRDARQAYDRQRKAASEAQR